MCFSATGSFVIGSALAAGGVVTARRASRSNSAYVIFSLMPLLFGVQQIFEGFVWIGLQRSLPLLTSIFAHAFVFFAFVFWPVYAPLAVYFTEKHESRRVKRILLLTSIIGILAGTGALILLLAGDLPIRAEVLRHSINYVFKVALLPQDIFVIFYLLAVIPPFLIVSDQKVNLFGMLLAISAGLSYLIFWYAFASVWCFFAAVLSSYIGYIAYTLPQKTSQ